MIAGDILGERARVLPEKCALVYVPTGERFSYAQLNRIAEQMARIWTAQLGLRKGERIGILAQNSPEYVCAFFAAGKSGIVLVPLNSRQTAHELSFVVQDAALSALLYESQFTTTMRELCALRPQMKLLALDGPAWQAAMAVTGSRGSGGTGGFQDVSRAGSPSAGIWPQGMAPEDLYCLLYTSGSTGRPKGVIIPHRMVLWNAYNTAVSWQMRDGDVIPIVTPLHHAGGLTVFLTPALLLGATIVLHRGFDASEIWRSIERERATLLMGVPTIFKMLMDAPEFSTADVSSVRWFISGGAPLPLYLLETYLARGIVLKQGYGLTEVGVNCFVISEGDARRKPGSIGKPILFTSAKLIDTEGRETAAGDHPSKPTSGLPGTPGQTGELCLRGPHVSLGYWNNQDATAAALDAEGWFHTGDNVRIDEEGFFYIVGRTRDMFISGGVNVYPAEVEAELLLHPQVEDAAVIGVAHEKWGEVGAAFVVLRNEKPLAGEAHPNAPPGAGELSAFLARRLARYKLPHHYIFVPELPRSAFGKVLKPELQKLFVERRQRAASE